MVAAWETGTASTRSASPERRAAARAVPSGTKVTSIPSSVAALPQ